MESLISQLRDSVQDLEERERFNKLAGAVRTMLECLGEDPNREGLQNTPERYAKTMLFFTKRRYEKSLSSLVNNALFHESHEGMVIVKNIDLSSLCEHHLLPFFGKVALLRQDADRLHSQRQSYWPVKDPKARRVLLATTSNSRKLTTEVAQGLFDVLNPRGVAIVVDGMHTCMMARGVQQNASRTTTSCMLGCFDQDPAIRAEFLQLIK